MQMKCGGWESRCHYRLLFNICENSNVGGGSVILYTSGLLVVQSCQLFYSLISHFQLYGYLFTRLWRSTAGSPNSHCLVTLNSPELTQVGRTKKKKKDPYFLSKAPSCSILASFQRCSAAWKCGQLNKLSYARNFLEAVTIVRPTLFPLQESSCVSIS